MEISLDTVVIEYLGERKYISIDFFLDLTPATKFDILENLTYNYILNQVNSLSNEKKKQLFKELKQKFELESSFDLNIEPEICQYDSETKETKNCI